MLLCKKLLIHFIDKKAYLRSLTTKARRHKDSNERNGSVNGRGMRLRLCFFSPLFCPCIILPLPHRSLVSASLFCPRTPLQFQHYHQVRTSLTIHSALSTYCSPLIIHSALSTYYLPLTITDHWSPITALCSPPFYPHTTPSRSCFSLSNCFPTVHWHRAFVS